LDGFSVVPVTYFVDGAEASPDDLSAERDHGILDGEPIVPTNDDLIAARSAAQDRRDLRFRKDAMVQAGALRQYIGHVGLELMASSIRSSSPG
jgi:hypothetical protein